MSQTVHRIELLLVFPVGLSAGEGSDGNVLTIARDGQGRPVLRGSALAGALRNAWRAIYAMPDVTDDDLFGADRGAEDAMLTRSPLEVPDCTIDCGKAGVVTRTHNQIHRHVGAALDGALFDIEALPPHSTVTAVLWLHADPQLDPLVGAVVARLAACFDQGLLLGGKSNRGFGIARLRDKVRHRRYDLGQTDDHAAWLDDHRQWRLGKAASVGDPVTPDAPANAEVLVVDLTLAVPRGQDFLVGDNSAFDVVIPPQRVIAADGKEYLRLPGSSLRGLMRGWVHRLAAREGVDIADSVENHRRMERDKEAYTGEAVGWGFLPKQQRKPGATIDCPVLKLFGSLAAAGRLHVSDALIPAAEKSIQKRTHVAIDRITGGAAEGLLFSNQVVTADSGGRAVFNVRMILRQPEEREVRWLAGAVKAIDLGLIRVGSSKAGGRLALTVKPAANGPFAKHFDFEVQS